MSKTKIIEILDLLDQESLFSLAHTVTQGLLKNKIVRKEDAVEAIINYSPDEKSILRRKVITREILLSYLHEKKIPVTLPVIKAELIDIILNNLEGDQRINTNGLLNDSNRISHVNTNTNLQTGDASIENVTNDTGNLISRTENSAEIDLLARKFTEWFYSILNDNSCGSEHFYADASIKLHMSSNGQQMSDSVENNAEEVRNKLMTVKMQYDLLFNPNLSAEGVRGQMDPHGLVIILVCGTLHTKGTCVGIFKQMFALARDPYAENNWKIKKTELHMKSQDNTIGPPQLNEVEADVNMSSLVSNDYENR